ncbi:MAG: hypothetical protein EOO13_07170 [Chitinophagaceae bacterium]|nr:MAG: hypothetical protein EOO13_07170 [Chitinophagaceae bacterium]
MFPSKHPLLVAVFLLITFAAIAGTPINGVTSFSTVSPGPKVSGNAGTASGITASNVEGFDFKLTTASSGPTMVIEVWDGFVGSGNGVAFYESTSSINPLFTGITIKANQGSLFDLNAIGINAQSSSGGNTTVTITGLNAGGTPVAGATVTALASVTSLTNFNLSANVAFKGISAIRITSSDLVYAFIDNISLANVGVLPLSWLDFSAKKQDKNVILNWSTAAEQATSEFVIQRSINGRDWDNISTTAAAGNSSVPTFYSYTDIAPSTSIIYYRVLQKDSNGQQSYSKIIFVDTKDNAENFSAYPTLVTNGILTIKLMKAQPVQIFNSAGKLMLVKKLSAGSQPLSLGNLPPGVYRIRAAAETISFIIK